MAYPFNNYSYPYQQNFQQPYQQPQQIQNSGFVSVRSIEEAFNWPVAPGNSITFKDENAPFVYTKTKGFSPLEQPTFERYRLVKEEETPQVNSDHGKSATNYDEQINMLWDEVNALKGKLNGNTDKPVRRGKKENNEPDESV